MTGQLAAEERLDLAKAIGLATEIRQVGDLGLNPGGAFALEVFGLITRC